MRRATLLTCIMVTAIPAAASEQIGSWTLTCSAPEPCQLRLTRRFLDKAGITGDFEVQASGETLVPVIALRGLPPKILMAATLAGTAQASIQFNNTAREDLICSSTVTMFLCVPRDNRALATALPTARTATVRVSVTLTGMPPFPEQEKSLDLSGTAEALARLRVAGPTNVPSLAIPGGIAAMADKLLKSAGYPNGLADLQALLAKYRGK